MKPDRELDALIAEKVMGKKVCGGPNNEKTRRVYYSPFGPDCWWSENETGEPEYIHAYSTDIAAAWEVVEKMERNGFFYSVSKGRIGAHGTNDKVWVSFGKSGDNIIWSESGTAANAICLAALKALGVKI